MLQLMFHEYAGKVAEINDAGLINVLNYILIQNIKFKLKLKLFFLNFAFQFTIIQSSYVENYFSGYRISQQFI